MKKALFIIVLVGLFVHIHAQEVPRNYVLVEIATGTWCGYCPGAALAADDLIENGDPVAIIENHYNDVFETTDSYERCVNYYGTTGYPTAQFDGSYDYVTWGHPDTSVYYLYKPIVDARIVIDTDFTLDIFGENDGDDYSLMARLQNVGGYDGDNLKLRIALTESEIEYVWQGLTELNFTNRMMLPDHNGTDLSEYDLTELTDIDLEFTFDNTWNDQHCELVVFIQDDDTKEVLQSAKVALNDLYIPIVADFEADVTSGCYGTVVNFTDLSVGEGTINYQWTFEGGTPETSTDQNPTVTYNTGGDFDVELTATDEHSTDTKSVSNFISISEIPPQPEVPDGDSQICNASTSEYSVEWITYSEDYEWELEPQEAGTLSVMDNYATLNPTESWTGDFTLRVRASNYCGTGDWSDEFEGTITESPEVFTLLGGGGYCFGGEGTEITLNGSESGMTYELFIGEMSTGTEVDGTGSEISFGLQTDTGYYAVQAISDYCTIDMSNQLEVFLMYPPDAPLSPTGETLVCNNQLSDYSSEGVVDADDYNWYLEPAEAGIISAEGMEASIEWNADFSGTANLTVAGVNICGEGTYSESLEILVDDCTDIEESFRDSDLRIFPNPVEDVLNISYRANNTGIVRILIYNQIGQILIEQENHQQTTDSKWTINISNFDKGLYILNIQEAEGVVSTRKFIKN